MRVGGVIHVDDILTDPRNSAREDGVLSPTGEEQEVGHLLRNAADRYDWLSLADCVRDPEYLARVRPLGGGEVGFDPDQPRRPIVEQLGTEWNPSLWIVKRGGQEAQDVVEVPFEPLPQGRLARWSRRWRQRRFVVRQGGPFPRVH